MNTKSVSRRPLKAPDGATYLAAVRANNHLPSQTNHLLTSIGQQPGITMVFVKGTISFVLKKGESLDTRVGELAVRVRDIIQPGAQLYRINDSQASRTGT